MKTFIEVFERVRQRMEGVTRDHVDKALINEGIPPEEIGELERRGYPHMGIFAAGAVAGVEWERERSELARLAADWDRYGRMIGHDQAWCNEMRYAVVVEMQNAVDRLWSEIR